MTPKLLRLDGPRWHQPKWEKRNKTNHRRSDWAGTEGEGGFCFGRILEGPVGWGIQVAMSSGQWETQAWNSKERSGQNRESTWEPSEYKKPLKSWVQMRLLGQVMEWEGTRDKSYPSSCLAPNHNQEKSFPEQGLGHYKEWSAKGSKQLSLQVPL